MHLFSRILMMIIISIGTHLSDEYINVDTSVLNESSSINIENLTTIEFLQNFSTKSTSFSQSPTSAKISLVDQINSYRNAQILSRIEQCDSSLKLNDLCEIYAIGNNTNLLVRLPLIRFQTFETIYDSLINRTMVEKLTNSCLIAQWCLGNLSQDDIDFVSSIIQKRGDSFCTLEQCHSRLLTFIQTCPSLSNSNISISTLKLFPMLCSLYKVQEKWSSTECIEEMAYFLHILYAFWSQFERCYDETSINSDTCLPVCQTFDDIFDRLEYRCSENASFFSQIPALSFYQSAKLSRICHQKSISQRFPFINSVDKIFSFSIFWNESKAKLLYLIFILIIMTCFIISFSLCLHSKLKRKHRRFEDNYEYTRIHNSGFELGQNTENTSLAMNDEEDDELQFDANGNRLPSSEHRRLLQVQL